MKKSILLCIAALGLANAAAASDLVTRTPNHQTTLKTSHSAQCSTPSAKASRQCAGTVTTASSGNHS